jgi:Flp pilus assembly protein CpaB
VWIKRARLSRRPRLGVDGIEMNLKGNGNGKGQGWPYLKFALLSVAVVLVAVLLYRQIDRLMGPRQAVWVATADLEPGDTIAGDRVELKNLRQKRLPAGALADRGAVEGQQLVRAKSAGTPFVSADFAAAGRDPGSITQLVPEGRVLTTLEVHTRSVPYPNLRRGDRLDVLAVLPQGGPAGSVASDAYYLGWIQPRNRGADQEKGTIFGIDVRPPGVTQTAATISLLLGLHPDHVVPVARAQAMGASISLVLHGSNEVKQGKLLDLPAPRTESVDLISGADRERVAVQR